MDMLITISWLFCSVLGGVVAAEYRRWIAGWIILCFFLGPLGLLAALLTGPAPGRQCPACREYSKVKATKCRYCGSALEAIE